jgi:hypothetical protein
MKVSHHILTRMGKDDVAYRAMRFRSAVAKQLETEWIKTYLKNNKVNVANGTLNGVTLGRAQAKQ